jgi:hypothetical protein
MIHITSRNAVIGHVQCCPSISPTLDCGVEVCRCLYSLRALSQLFSLWISICTAPPNTDDFLEAIQEFFAIPGGYRGVGAKCPPLPITNPASSRVSTGPSPQTDSVQLCSSKTRFALLCGSCSPEVSDGSHHHVRTASQTTRYQCLRQLPNF